MDVPRTLAGALALNRTAFGLNYLLRPQEARKSWIGRVARRPAAQVMIRSQGVRDVALGVGALRALTRGETPELRSWVTGQVVCDLTDLVTTWATQDALPKRGARLAIGVAGASTLVGAAAVAGLSVSSARPPT